MKRSAWMLNLKNVGLWWKMSVQHPVKRNALQKWELSMKQRALPKITKITNNNAMSYQKWNDDIRVFFVNASDQCEEVPEEVCSSVMEQICEGQGRDERNNQQQRREKRSPFFGQLLKAKENFLAFLVQTLTGWNGGQNRRSTRKPRHREL